MDTILASEKYTSYQQYIYLYISCFIWKRTQHTSLFFLDYILIYCYFINIVRKTKHIFADQSQYKKNPNTFSFFIQSLGEIYICIQLYFNCHYVYFFLNTCMKQTGPLKLIQKGSLVYWDSKSNNFFSNTSL